jgi:hypothetical protein
LAEIKTRAIYEKREKEALANPKKDQNSKPFTNTQPNRSNRPSNRNQRPSNRQTDDPYVLRERASNRNAENPYVRRERLTTNRIDENPYEKRERSRSSSIAAKNHPTAPQNRQNRKSNRHAEIDPSNGQRSKSRPKKVESEWVRKDLVDNEVKIATPVKGEKVVRVKGSGKKGGMRKVSGVEEGYVRVETGGEKVQKVEKIQK